MPSDEKVDLTVYLACPSRKQSVPGSAADLDDLQSRRVTLEQLEQERTEFLAVPFDRVGKNVRAAGGKVAAVDPLRRQMHIEVPSTEAATSFDASRHIMKAGRVLEPRPTAAMRPPAATVGDVLAVVGMNKRQFARKPGLRRLRTMAAHMVPNGLSPAHVGGLYGFKAHQNAGSGQCVAIIEPAGGFSRSDLAAACQGMGIAVPDVREVSVLGGRNAFGENALYDKEVSLDVQVIAGVAPKARIVVYFTPFDERGMADGLSAAIYDKVNRPNVVVMTWGEPETQFPSEARMAMDGALADAVRLGITVITAAGDGLATDRVGDGRAHVDYPASSPYVLSCGGTAITLDAAGNSIANEVVWNEGQEGTGGGISDLYPVPAFQNTALLPASFNDGGKRRGVPDVAAAAAAMNGYRIIVNGVEDIASGTSAVAPLWAAAIALVNADRGEPVGYINSQLYRSSALFRQITKGDNIESGTTIGYQAGPGWNACTGLGSPIGAELFRHLTAIG